MIPIKIETLLEGRKVEQKTLQTWTAEASDFTEKTFYGPIWKQVRDALDYIKTNLIEETVLPCRSLKRMRTELI